MVYSLSKEVTNEWILSDVEGRGTVNLFHTSQCETKNGAYTCTATIKLSQSELVKPVTDAKDKNVPVKLRIRSTAPGSTGEEITSFTFDLINASAVKQKLEDIKTGIEKGTIKDDNEAKVKVATALGLTAKDPNTDEGKKNQAALDYVVSLFKDKKANKDKFLTILKFVGNVGAGFFGVPIRIP